MKTIITISTLTIFLLIMTGYFMYQEEKKWEVFKIEHDCQEIEFVQGGPQTSFGTGITSNGTVGIVTITTVTPDKICYLCNDGKKYWR